MIGKTLGHYEITAKIGQGGMGEVYRARDTKLGREVALKILTAEVASDPERRRRFELEARAVAALRHPNIVTIYAAEEVGGIAFLTMELLEGDDLRSKIRGGGIDVDAFLEIAVTLSDAVAAAHAKGITHRDLKPSNVMIEGNGDLKILDFGLAKLVETEDAARDPDATMDQMTRAGSILGTLPYMSPEQLSGAPIDHRSDIFSLGTILFELATGKHPFAGSSEAEIVSAILRDDAPSLETLAPAYPQELRTIIRECLAKDLGQRRQNVARIHEELRELQTETPSQGPGGRSARPLFFAAAILMMSVVGWSLWPRGNHGPKPTSRAATASASQLTSASALEEWPAWAPDGVSFVCSEEQGEFKKLVRHELATRATRQLTTGDGDDLQATWSSDGRRIAFVRSRDSSVRLRPSDVYGHFYEGGDVWSLDVESAEAELLVADAFHPAFSPSGTRLAVDAVWAGPRRIWTTDERGRNPRQISSDESEAATHTTPSWSPDERWIAYRISETTRSDIALVEVASGRSWRLTNDQYQDMHPTWDPRGGAVLFCSNRAGGINIWRVSVDEDGQRSGVAEQMTFGPGQDLQIAITPDGTRVLYTILGINSDIWRIAVDPKSAAVRGSPEPVVASTREDSRASWSPDSSTLAFNSDRLGDMNIWLHTLADGSERPLTEGPGGDYQPVWSGDGSWIAFFSSRSGNPDIWRVDIATKQLSQLTDHPALDTNPAVSPDGRWLVFQSDREGRKEVWIMPATGGEARVLSREGTSDHFMRWSGDSRFVYFDGIHGAVVHRVDIETGEDTELAHIRGGAHMSLSPDFQSILDVSNHRTLWLTPVEPGEAVQIFEMPSADLRLDYPAWSFDGEWVAFDRVQPSGGDIWMLSESEQ